MVAKARTLPNADICSLTAGQDAYDHLKSIVTLAKKNGWDLDGLGLVPRDLAFEKQTTLTKKQILERDRLIRSILGRFSSLLTPPVPPDLEQSILKRDKRSWLPWEREVIERTTSWRREMGKVKPQILRGVEPCSDSRPDVPVRREPFTASFHKRHWLVCPERTSAINAAFF